MAIDRTQLIERIKKIDGLTNEERSSLLELLRTTPKYGLVWENKPEDVETQLQDELPVFTEVKELAIISDNPNAPNHIIVEGDNLHALTALTYTHESKIDVIYIDPPYNTGNKDFIYNDSYVDRRDGYRHSKWLSFMAKRLRIAKRLLSEKGVIIISIDDNEQAQLKLLCDEIFGEQNFIATLPRITKASGKTTDKIANNHDYVLIYSKSVESCRIIGIPHDDEGYKYVDEHFQERGKYKLNQTLDYDSLSYSDSLDYPITLNNEVYYPGGNYDNYLKRKSGSHKRADWAWRWSQTLFEFGLNNDFIVVKTTKNGKRIYTKTYQKVNIEKVGNGYRLVSKDRLKPIQSIQLVNNEFSNDNAKKELAKIFEDSPFDYPKPTSIMAYLLQAIPDTLTVLDFFAGSGTTLHATIQLNAEDGGKRQCILVTNNENGICENVTYERNRRVIQGYTTLKGEEIPGLVNNSLRYYRTDFVPRERTQKNMRQLVFAATDMLCIKNNLYTETGQLGGRRMHPSFARHFQDGDKEMLIIYEDQSITFIVEMLKTIHVKTPILTYVFSPNNYPYTDEFYEVADKVKLCALPAAIYDAYRKVLPKQKPSFLETERENVVAVEDDDNLGGLFDKDILEKDE